MTGLIRRLIGLLAGAVLASGTPVALAATEPTFHPISRAYSYDTDAAATTVRFNPRIDARRDEHRTTGAPRSSTPQIGRGRATKAVGRALPDDIARTFKGG